MSKILLYDMIRYKVTIFKIPFQFSNFSSSKYLGREMILRSMLHTYYRPNPGVGLQFMVDLSMFNRRFIGRKMTVPVKTRINAQVVKYKNCQKGVDCTHRMKMKVFIIIKYCYLYSFHLVL